MRSAQEARQMFLPTVAKRFKSPEPKTPASDPPAPVVIKNDVIKSNFVHDPERDDAFCSVDIWIRKNTDFKPLLLAGPAGSGKTTLIQEYSKSIYETYYDQDLSDFLSSTGLRPKTLGVIDCIESLDAKEREIVKKSFSGLKRRLILTTEDLFAEPAKTWKKNCTVISLKEPSKQFLKRVYESACLVYNGEPSFPVDRFSAGHRDAVSDPIKCTRLMLLGQKTPELLSDISFLSILLQANSLQTTQNISELSKALDRYSFADLIDHELDAQSLWTYHELATRVGPKLTASMPWTFQWPRSLQPKKTYAYC
jgi:shikimate kinase